MQKRWKSIRGCFTRELNRQKSLKSGSGRGPRKSEYIYFKQLLFLQKVVALREPEVVTSKESEASDPDVEKNSQQDRQVVNGPKRMKTKEKTAPEDDKFIEVLNKSIKTREQNELENQDEDRLFMLSLVNTLKKVPPQKKMVTKIKIMTLLEEATRFVPNINDSGLNHQTYNWSQQTEPSSSNYHPGYSTLRGDIDNNFGYSVSAPPSNITNVSEDSSILD